MTFYLCDNQYGIDIRLVKEINRKIKYTPVPGAPPHIVGLFNMRGQVVTLFDLAEILGYDDLCEKDNPTCIILKNREQRPDFVGFLVDKLGDVRDVSPEECEMLPVNGDQVQDKYLKEIIKTESQLIMSIDPDKIFV